MTQRFHERRWRHVFSAILMLIAVLTAGSFLLHLPADEAAGS